ncbi:hypothetical protein HK405_014306, partial [Cladochytrium tenue]
PRILPPAVCRAADRGRRPAQLAHRRLHPILPSDRRGFDWPQTTEAAANTGGALPVDWTLPNPLHVLAASASSLSGLHTDDLSDVEAGLEPGCRAMTRHKDFANMNIRVFFQHQHARVAAGVAASRAGISSGAIQEWSAWRWLLLAVTAGMAGWKAFALRLHFAMDPVGRMRRFSGRPLQVDELLGDNGERLRTAIEVHRDGWKPASGVIPLDVEGDSNGRMRVKTYRSLLLVANVDLAPGVVVMTRQERRDDEGVLSELSWVSALGPALREDLDWPNSRFQLGWDKRMWNRYFRLMFLAYGGETRVDFDLFLSSIWEFFNVA